jgi:hypothetical protein
MTSSEISFCSGVGESQEGNGNIDPEVNSTASFSIPLIVLFNREEVENSFPGHRQLVS